MSDVPPDPEIMAIVLYCECDEYVHLGVHSAHERQDHRRPHPMGE